MRFGMNRLIVGCFVTCIVILLPFLADYFIPKAIRGFYYHSQNRRGSIDEVLKIPLKDWNKVNSQGHSILPIPERNYWYRIPINVDSFGEPWIFEYTFQYASFLDIYVFTGDKLAAEYHGGHERRDIRENVNLYPKIKFIPERGMDTIVYLSISPGTLASMTPLAMPEAAHLRWEIMRTLLFGSLFGTFLGLILFNLSLYATTRQTVFLNYSLYQISGFIFCFSYSCINFQIFPILHEYWMLYIRLIWIDLVLLFVFAERFISDFLNTKLNMPKICKFFRRLSSLSIIMALSYLFIPIWLVIALTMVLVTISISIFFPVIILEIKKNPVFEFIFAWGLVFLCGMITILSYSGLVPSSAITNNYIYVGFFWELIFLSIALGNRIKSLTEERNIIKSVLIGQEPESRLNEIMERPYGLSYRVTEKNVSVMFVDIVGFSLLSQKMSSSELFSHLSSLIKDVAKIVVDHNGTIDRSLGDGILCFFGYNEDDSRVHARQALDAAISIQELSFNSIFNSHAKGPNVPILPLRVGIHTDQVHIGNLGGQGRFDVTIIGNGVNYASRLQSACNPFRIIISENTKNVLFGKNDSIAELNKINFTVKHQKNLFAAYEYNTFFNREEMLQRIEKNFNIQLGHKRVFDRNQTGPGATITLKINDELFNVINFSIGGVAIEGEIYFSRKAVSYGEIIFLEEAANERLAQYHLNILQFEVKWSFAKNGKYMHGVEWIGINDGQKKIVYDVFFKSLERAERIPA